MLRLYQYKIRILRKSGPYLFIADQLSRQDYGVDKDEEIPGIWLSIDTVHSSTDMPAYMCI